MPRPARRTIVVAALGSGQQREDGLIEPAAVVLDFGLGNERRVVGGPDVEGTDDHHQDDHRHLDCGDHRGKSRRQFGAQRDQGRHQRDDHERTPVELQRSEMACAITESEHGAQVAGPAFGDHGRTHRQFQHQIPADHPGQELPEGGIREGIGAAGHRQRRGELGVAQRGQRTGRRRDQKRYPDGRAGDIASGRRGNREYSGANHHRDAENNQVPPGEVLAQPSGGLVGVGD